MGVGFFWATAEQSTPSAWDITTHTLGHGGTTTSPTIVPPGLNTTLPGLLGCATLHTIAPCSDCHRRTISPVRCYLPLR